MKLMLENECVKRKFWHLIRTHMAYIDDSAAIARTKEAAWAWLATWKDLMDDLGMPWSEVKITCPTQLLLLLGILISCTNKPTLSVEQSRLDKAVKLMARYKKGGSFTLKEAQSVMGSIAFVAQVVRFASTFNRGLALQTTKFHNWARCRGKSSSGSLMLPIDSRVLADWSILEVIFKSFNGVDATAPTSYKCAPAGPAQCDASFWGGGFFVHGHYSHVVWKDEGITIFDSNGEVTVSTTYVEALGLRHLLRSCAKYWVERYIVICLDNSALVASMRGERSKSEQVLPIVLDCVSIIIAFAIKPSFVTIGTDDMWFADPLSRYTHPRKAELYKKLFKKRLHSWSRDNIAWRPHSGKQPPTPSALSIRAQWEAEKERLILDDNTQK